MKLSQPVRIVWHFWRFHRIFDHWRMPSVMSESTEVSYLPLAGCLGDDATWLHRWLEIPDAGIHQRNFPREDSPLSHFHVQIACKSSCKAFVIQRCLHDAHNVNAYQDAVGYLYVCVRVPTPEQLREALYVSCQRYGIGRQCDLVQGDQNKTEPVFRLGNF
jgi:hypothetical protein